MVATFTTSPGDLELILYVSHRILDDLEALPVLSVPTPEVEEEVEEEEVEVEIEATPTLVPLELGEINKNSPGTGFSIWVGAAPSFILVSLVLGFWFVRKE